MERLQGGKGQESYLRRGGQARKEESPELVELPSKSTGLA
jgi:hypothetical protein